MNYEQERYPIRPQSRSFKIAVRAIDIVLGSALFLASLPFILLAAIAIAIETKGSPVFIQKRVGLGGNPFRIFKLRGMFTDAHKRFPELYDYAKYTDLNFRFHFEDDPRVTAVGAFLRRTSIDELPNFLNVVLGDMTLVGPRPEVPDLELLYGEYAEKYFSVKPGISCLSKISGRDCLTKKESIELDLKYVENMSLSENLRILFLTFKNVLLRTNVFSGRMVKSMPPAKATPAVLYSLDFRRDAETLSMSESKYSSSNSRPGLPSTGTDVDL